MRSHPRGWNTTVRNVGAGGAFFAAATAVFVAVTSSLALAQTDDAEAPPGNPVVGSDRAGDIETVSQTNYGLWTLVAVCLILAGVLLVWIERWERNRSESQAS